MRLPAFIFLIFYLAGIGHTALHHAGDGGHAPAPHVHATKAHSHSHDGHHHDHAPASFSRSENDQNSEFLALAPVGAHRHVYQHTHANFVTRPAEEKNPWVVFVTIALLFAVMLACNPPIFFFSRAAIFPFPRPPSAMPLFLQHRHLLI